MTAVFQGLAIMLVVWMRVPAGHVVFPNAVDPMELSNQLTLCLWLLGNWGASLTTEALKGPSQPIKLWPALAGITFLDTTSRALSRELLIFFGGDFWGVWPLSENRLLRKNLKSYTNFMDIVW